MERIPGIIRKQYHAHDKDLRGVGSAGGHMWRFIREMKAGDLVVAPHGAE
ncbi:MAG: hypothetical protein OXB98_17405 [Bryobacterales bacterium]|nr:hypothetical protein [Bryobacterales bacterium]